MNARHVADTEAALAGTVAALDDGNAQIAALEDELVAARSTVDGWQNMRWTSSSVMRRLGMRMLIS
ncbi:hypothetical protein [Mycobacterium sp. 1245801.1]|uniref:hypothetical protein n=1 Tax=Mycobacterium sp. 1245801.1 TaxID=1834075 RepID=UPI0007FFF3DA|nr:hypothetical protein [Mycobacterium sp. 1245801.1]OBJ27012.1 hypothetical protein A5622_07690 [Mycobacterium sp. 1245801.1]